MNDMVTEVGQVLVSCIILIGSGVVMLLAKDASLTTSLLVMDTAVVSFWVGGKTSQSGTKATNGTLEKILDQLNKAQTLAVNAAAQDAGKPAQPPLSGGTGPSVKVGA